VNIGTRPLVDPVKYRQPQSPDMDWLYRLPWRDWLELEPAKTAPREARQRLAGNLAEWSLGQFEVVTNALTATAAAAVPAPIWVWLLGGPSAVALLAWDVSTEPPVPRATGDGDESGRGLAIVDGLSAGWGYYFPAAEYGGKVTWAVIDRP
jgi:hypothetical protein